VIFQDGRITARQHHELVAVVIDGAIPPQQRQLTDRTLSKGWTKVRVDELDEPWPRRRATVELDTVVPNLGVVEEVEGGHLHAPVLRSAVEPEVALTTVKPWHWVAEAIKFGEVDLVRSGVPLAGVLDVAVQQSAVARVLTAPGGGGVTDTLPTPEGSESCELAACAATPEDGLQSLHIAKVASHGAH
jgi:hypothetical protein